MLQGKVHDNPYVTGVGPLNEVMAPFGFGVG